MEYAPPRQQVVARAPVEERVAYLRRVAGITLLGLGVSAVSALLSSVTIAPLALSSQIGTLVLFFGSFGVANYLCPRMVFGDQKWLGFFLGTVAEGAAIGMLLLAAVALAGISGGILLVGQAIGLTGLAALGIAAYVWTGPEDLSWLKAGLSALTLPMLLLMGISFAFPIGGIWGVGLSALFVLVSVGGLLYQGNQVVFRLNSRQHIEGAYLITLGVLVLFWNLLTLLMSLSGRD